MKWISVEDQLPTETETILVFIQKNDGLTGQALISRLYNNIWTFDHYMGTTFRKDFTVTHWMPLPKSPTESQNKEEDPETT